MIKMFKIENKPITQATIDVARKLHQEGYCIWCDVPMHSQRTAAGEWRMVCHDGYTHTNPVCITNYKNHKTVLEWRKEDWETILSSMDHEDPLPTEGKKKGVPPEEPDDDPDQNSDENPDEDPDNYPEDEDIDTGNAETDPDEHPGEKKEPDIIYRPPRTMHEVVHCGVLFLMNLGAMFANNVRIGDRITSYIDRKWMFIALFATLLHIAPGFLTVPKMDSYHAFQFVPTCISRKTIEGTMALQLYFRTIYINFIIKIEPTLSGALRRNLSDYFIRLRDASLITNPNPKTDYDHFLATELIAASGKWRMTIPPHKAGNYLRATFSTTVRSKYQLAICRGAMKWLKAQGEDFNGVNVK